MTTHRFVKIATTTANTFWLLVYEHVTPEEANYLRTTPVARRNLDRRLVSALAQTLLSPDQLHKLDGLHLEDPQTDIQHGSSTETPFKKPIPEPNQRPRKEPHP